jgi:DNA invertase Pin-like site-specific DNA recombinase
LKGAKDIMDRAAIYCRLSKEDFDKLNKGDDSESIQNQKLLLMDYATDHDMLIYKVYSDDDYSGTDKDRPNWNKMLLDAKNGEFNVIICKSQSRFTRDMEISEKYFNGLFIEWGIRFIGVVDGVDTNIKGNKKARQINGLVNEWYVEELSENIKAVFRKKMEDGQFLGSFACYGYKKDPEDRHKIVVDNEAAKVVKKIFDLYLQGYSVKQITNILTNEKILTPTQYKNSLGYKYQNVYASNFSTQYGIWGISTVKRILNNEAYVGTLIQGREKKVSYKSKKVVIAPADEWVVIQNNHEAIIDISIFNRVQQLMKSKRTVSTNLSSEKRKAHCLAGKIKCKDCGSSMIKTGGYSPNRQTYIRCQLANKTRNKECTSHTVSLNKLIELVSNEIHNLIDSVLNDEANNDVIEKILTGRISLEKKLNGKQQELKNIVIKMDDIKRAVSTLYMDKVKGIVTETMYMSNQQNFENDLNKLKEEHEKIKSDIEILQKENVTRIDVAVMAKQYAEFEELTNEIVNDFIDYIEIGEKDVYGNRDVEIHWNI